MGLMYFEAAFHYRCYNHYRPHSALGYKPPVPLSVVTPPLGFPVLAGDPRALTQGVAQ